MPRLLLRLLLSTTLFLSYFPNIIAADFDRARPERLGMSSDRLERLDAVLKSYVDKEQIAGQVVLVLRNGQIAFFAANGMQDIEAGIEARPEINGMQSQGMYDNGPGVSLSGDAGLLSTANDYAKLRSGIYQVIID